jgi:hypothetical protein
MQVANIRTGFGAPAGLGHAAACLAALWVGFSSDHFAGRPRIRTRYKRGCRSCGMKFRRIFAASALCASLAVGIVVSGCRRPDVRAGDGVPGPGRPSAADQGRPVVTAEQSSRGYASGDASTSPFTGTDSTGRPGSASGGTTGGGRSSGTSGTLSGPAPDPIDLRKSGSPD